MLKWVVHIMSIFASTTVNRGEGMKLTTRPPSSAEVKNGGAIPPLPHMSSWHSA
jgi:hypothetical protein